MSRATPWNRGLPFALLWLVVQFIVWVAVLLATMFLSVLLVFLVGGTLDPTNWKAYQ